MADLATLWVANHPEALEADAIGFGNWTNVEEAAANRLLTAEYSAGWATYLEDNGCVYDEGC